MFPTRIMSCRCHCVASFAVAVTLGGVGPLSRAGEVENRSQVSSLRPNIIFIMPDDMGWGDIAAHGNPLIQTPSIDRLHHESVRFTDFHVSPTCSPTRSALMTGRH